MVNKKPGALVRTERTRLGSIRRDLRVVGSHPADRAWPHSVVAERQVIGHRSANGRLPRGTKLEKGFVQHLFLLSFVVRGLSI